MVLCHGRFGPILNVADELLSVGKWVVVTVEISCFFFVHQEKMVAAIMSRDVDIFTQLNVSVRTENRESAIAPATEAVRRKPIHPYVSSASVASYRRVTKILKIWILRIMNVACFEATNLFRGGACEE